MDILFRLAYEMVRGPGSWPVMVSAKLGRMVWLIVDWWAMLSYQKSRSARKPGKNIEICWFREKCDDTQWKKYSTTASGGVREVTSVVVVLN